MKEPDSRCETLFTRSIWQEYCCIKFDGLLVEMIGERNKEKVKRNMIRIERRVEDDERIRPGTARVSRTENETFEENFWYADPDAAAPRNKRRPPRKDDPR